MIIGGSDVSWYVQSWGNDLAWAFYYLIYMPMKKNILTIWAFIVMFVIWLCIIINQNSNMKKLQEQTQPAVDYYQQNVEYNNKKADIELQIEQAQLEWDKGFALVEKWNNQMKEAHEKADRLRAEEKELDMQYLNSMGFQKAQ